MNESSGKSMRDILQKIFKCPKEQQYIRNVVHQDFGNKFHIFLDKGFRVNAGAYVETLQVIVVKPSWIDSVAVFQQELTASHKALKTQD
ncbi:hypothetical protein ACTXT7_011274 [Hymenolepis weldensis]